MAGNQTITVDFNANLARFTSSIDKATADLNKFQSNASRIAGQIKGAFGGLGAYLSVREIGGFIKSTIDAMAGRGWGRIVNISSVNGQKGACGQTNYSAAKAGMHGFTKALALEVARKGVTVNTISPGYIGTKMVTAIPQEVLDSKIIPQIPMGRLGKPEEVAWQVAYLASEAGDFYSGSVLTMDGSRDNWLGPWPPTQLINDAGKPVSEDRK